MTKKQTKSKITDVNSHEMIKLNEVIDECLLLADNAGISRVVLTTEPFEAETMMENVNIRLSPFYYDSLLTTPLERKVQQNQTDYQVISLNTGKKQQLLRATPVNHILNESYHRGLEVITRKFLESPEMRSPHINKNYLNEEQQFNIVASEGQKSAAEYLLSIGIRSTDFKKLFFEGLAEARKVYESKLTLSYQDQVRRRFQENEPVFNKKIGERIRLNIAYAAGDEERRTSIALEQLSSSALADLKRIEEENYSRKTLLQLTNAHF